MRRRLLILSALLALASLSAVALASNDETITTNEPHPGGTITADSQAIGSSEEVLVTIAGGLGKTTIAVEGGVKSIAKETGEAVAACWLAGPGAIPVTNARIKDLLSNDPDVREFYDSAGPDGALAICMLLVKTVAEDLAAPPSGRIAARRCKTKAINLRFTRRNGKRVVRLATKARPSTRYTCAKVKGGITLRARRTNGKPLRRELGSKLGVGLYKTTDGPPSDGRLTLRYRLR